MELYFDPGNLIVLKEVSGLPDEGGLLQAGRSTIFIVEVVEVDENGENVVSVKIEDDGDSTKSFVIEKFDTSLLRKKGAISFSQRLVSEHNEVIITGLKKAGSSNGELRQLEMRDLL